MRANLTASVWILRVFALNADRYGKTENGRV